MNKENPKLEEIYERNTFLFLTVLLAPILSITLVAGFGFIYWISQLFLGPPGA